jgi:hypothetical protein
MRKETESQSGPALKKGRRNDIEIPIPQLDASLPHSASMLGGDDALARMREESEISHRLAGQRSCA